MCIRDRGYEAHVVPRSSTFKNFGIIQTNHMGVIDESYCGDNDQWHFPAYAPVSYTHLDHHIAADQHRIWLECADRCHQRLIVRSIHIIMQIRQKYAAERSAIRQLRTLYLILVCLLYTSME